MKSLLIKEQRTHKRIKVILPLTYTYFGEYKIAADKGITYDISDSGICFYTNKPLRSGVTLIIQLPHIWDDPKTCTVRWNSMKSPNCFKVGASFI